ncbi:MAG: hypothetical protein BWY66_01643 [bacterium ADurb.Bin374]|nr:MAG: hypothetical protein BWY66_01643 [bacterium ADurb.Bin374]
MQPRGRRGDRALLAREHGLITLGGAFPRRDIGRKRHLSVLAKDGDDVPAVAGPEHAQPRFQHGFDGQRGAAGNRVTGTRFEPSPGPHHRLAPAITQIAHEQDLRGLRTRRRAGEQPGRNDAGAVHDEQVPRWNQRKDVTKRQVVDGLHGAIEDEKPRRRPLRGRSLGDQFGRKVEIEQRRFHRVPQRDWDAMLSAGGGAEAVVVRAASLACPRVAKGASRSSRERVAKCLAPIATASSLNGR